MLSNTHVATMNNLVSGATRVFSQPVLQYYSETVDHNPPISTDPRGQFSIMAPDVASQLYSTTLATANTSMTGTVIECIEGQCSWHTIRKHW